MEIFSYHAGLNKVVEIGNSGMFRPEMLRPMGLPEDVVVIAWGLSLERCVLVVAWCYPELGCRIIHSLPLLYCATAQL